MFSDDASCRTARFGFLAEEQIAEMVEIPPEVIRQFESPDALRSERLNRFRKRLVFTLKNILVVLNEIVIESSIQCFVARVVRVLKSSLAIRERAGFFDSCYSLF